MCVYFHQIKIKRGEKIKQLCFWLSHTTSIFTERSNKMNNKDYGFTLSQPITNKIQLIILHVYIVCALTLLIMNLKRVTSIAVYHLSTALSSRHNLPEKIHPMWKHSFDLMNSVFLNAKADKNNEKRKY